MSPHQVAIICRSFISGDGEIRPGGAERVILHIAQYLEDRGVAVKVHQNGDRQSITKLGAVTVVTHKFRFIGKSRKIARKVAKEGADLLLFQEVSQAYRPKSDTPGITILGINHGVYWDYELTEDTAKWLPFNFLPEPALRFGLNVFRRVAKWREIHGLKVSDLVMAFDTGLLRIVQSDYPHLRHRIQRVYPFSDLVRVPPVNGSGQPPHHHSDAPSERPAVIFVPRNYSLSSGLFWLRDIALHLSRLIPEANWTIRVAGNISTAEKEEEIIDYLTGSSDLRYQSISNRIEFLGSLSREQFVPELESASIVLIPTFAYEGACLAAVEAISFGKTLVATNVGGLNDTVIDGLNGFLCQPNPLSIALKVAECFSETKPLNLPQPSEGFWSRRYSMQTWYEDLDQIFGPLLP